MPQNINLDAYIRLFTEFNLHIYFKNSLFYSILGCILTIILITPAAYAIARMKWKLSKITLGFLLSGIMIPVHAIIIPLYITSSMFQISKVMTLLLIYVATAIPTSVFILIGFMENIPRSLEESAVLDGCSIQMAFLNIVCPILKPALATVTILNFNNIWNDFMLALIFLSEERLKTIQLGITKFSSSTATNYPLLLSAIVLVIVPSIIVFLIMSESLVNGIAAGAVKG
jgi:raffinose/stachyose/melibiose transport system permease protein